MTPEESQEAQGKIHHLECRKRDIQQAIDTVSKARLQIEKALGHGTPSIATFLEQAQYGTGLALQALLHVEEELESPK